MLPLASTLWTNRMVLDALSIVGLVLLFSFGLTLICVGGYYLYRVGRGFLGGLGGSAAGERAAGADQASRLALLSVVCGPTFTVIFTILILPILIFAHGFGIRHCLLALAMMFGIGLVVGLIGGGSVLRDRPPAGTRAQANRQVAPGQGVGPGLRRPGVTRREQ